MTWFRVDDSLAQHPKLDGLRAERLACVLGVWTLCGTDCAARGLDGYVSRDRLDRLFGGVSKQLEAAVSELVARGFWEQADGGWLFHDWADYQLTAEEVAEKRRAAARRQRDRRTKSRSGHTPVTRDSERDAGVTHATVTQPSQCESQGYPLRAPARAPDPDPTRPDPTLCERAPAAPAGTHTPSAADGNTDRPAVLAELGRHAALALVNHRRLADGILATQTSRPVPVSWLVLAIAQAAGAIDAEEAGGSQVPTAARAKLVVSYCRNAKAPNAGAPTEPDRAALKARPSTRLTEVEAAPPPPAFVETFGKRRAGGDS